MGAREVVVRRRTVALFLAGAALVSSCSPTASPESESPVVTGILQPFTATWEPANDVDQIMASARSDLIGFGGSVLVPTSLLPGTRESAGRLVIRKTFPTDQVSVVVNITFSRNQRDEALSLTSALIDSGYPTCADRITSDPDTRTVEVRSSPACVLTNSAGLSFIEWAEGSHWYHVETFMEPDVVIAWLTDWTPIP